MAKYATVANYEDDEKTLALLLHRAHGVLRYVKTELPLIERRLEAVIDRMNELTELTDRLTKLERRVDRLS